MASDESKLEYRVMGDYSISKSYKGILRIAHIMETVGTEDDYFLNSTYYGVPKTLMDISGSDASSKVYGYPNAGEGFEGKVKRYISEKEYEDKKLPMTDSMGNYLNWNIGVEGTTIGSDTLNNGYSIFRSKVRQNGYDVDIIQPNVFPILESRELVIGLEPKLRGDEKVYLTNAGKFHLLKDEMTPALVISNLYDNSPSNLTSISDENDTIKSYKFKKDEKYKHRTVYKVTKELNEEYDAYFYCQENYNEHNYNCDGEELINSKENDIEYNKSFDNIEKGKIIDAEVDIFNLKDYVKELIAKYMKSNTVEVPTGSVIWQYISLAKWYGTNDAGTGNFLTNDCNVGHRPNMSQRSTTEGNTIWNDSTIQGASRKSNKLSVRNNRYKEQTEEDSAFDSARLNEIIPLYKRDYVLCDGSTYFIYLIENTSTNIEIKKKYESYDRFINLFYTIGYNYSKAKSGNPYSDIKSRYFCEWVDDKFKFQNLTTTHDIIEDDEKTYIDETNYIKYNEDEGRPRPAEWESHMKNLKDSDTLYAIDMATMMAYKMLLEEDKRDIDSAFVENGKYNREKAEEWLKKQKLPEEFIISSFVGDTNETIIKYNNYSKEKINAEDFVLSFPYEMTDGDIVKVNIGREVTTFDSFIKYFVPSKDGGEYCICKVWQIPEIQYILDVMIAGAGERNHILPSKFEYKFKVPNITETRIPKFIGSTGYNWRDQKNNDMEVSGSWSSTYTVGTIPHRHAIFKGSLSGFGKNEKIQHFKGEVLSNQDSIPTASSYLHTYEYMPEGGKNGAAGGEVDDNTGSYVWNELAPSDGLYYEEDINHFGIKIIQRGGFGLESNPYSNFWYSYYAPDSNGNNTTGVNKNAGDVGPWGTVFQKTGVKNRTKRESYHPYPQSSTTDYSAYEKWFISDDGIGGEIAKWHSFHHDEDQRFNNMEPNRCATSVPHIYTPNKYIIYKKNDMNEAETPDGTSFYFSPENVKALPLIKL